MTLGRLTRVDLRNIWETEAQDFTPWLAEEPNLSLLGDTLGLELELEAVEKNVGVFRADILCRDTLSDGWVLIENQLERTDHTHLGQLLTYAAGLDAVTIVWVAAKVAEEHRAAMDWLNEITAAGVRFFAVEVELWRIEASAVAPKFSVICRPNDWSREATAGREAINEQDLSPLKQTYLQYWRAFEQKVAKDTGPVRDTKAQPRHWADHAIGRSGFILRMSLNSQENWIRAELYLNKNVARGGFARLYEQREQFDAAFGAPLDWQALPGKGASRVCAVLDQANPTNEADWSRQHEWMLEAMNRLHRTFHRSIQNLPGDLSEEETPE